jgi:DNA-binding CsgD family transcriptional regulator
MDDPQYECDDHLIPLEEYVKRLWKQNNSIDTIMRCAEISESEIKEILEMWDEND